MRADLRIHVAVWASALALLAVSGRAQAQSQDTAPRGYAVQPFTPKGFKLPDGNGCAGDVARWQAVQANDYAGGNVGLRVYNEIQNEIDRAAALCAAGQDAAARKLIAASKSRHGYPQ